MNILGRVKRIPGGLLIVPMLLAAVINTLFPSFFQIGDPTTALFTSKGTMVLIGMILLVSGTQLNLSQLLTTLKRAGVLCISRIIISCVFGSAFVHFFGIDGIGGVSAVAFIAVLTSCNPGLYLALMNSYGDDVDRAAFGILNLIAVPVIPIMILNSASGVGIDYLSVLATLVPFLIGILLGNLDSNIQKMFAPGTLILLPFLGTSFGSNINLRIAFQSSLSGLLVTALFLVICLLPLIGIDRVLLKRPGYAAAATCSVAGLSMVVPSMAAGFNPAYEPYVEAAIAQIAFAVILTSILIPYMVKRLAQPDSATESGK
ncbi:2-keto-3-deoxygluconate permease [Paenibacillus sp. UMB7766-LJ446]|uniref:2-keto-3-deoxygluconate permease n=1 Tax=Paenibacillus sp. UMB7766-LJ446 TaxID=3046313 RepID=UPI00254F4ED3|nr:2-keto-3-deoxygluconate permease [Paenibacillus sp. UMB7766-LJ446]MDK8193888.1 2-keto-3-deoxygluconate permease [Paenibacillus sp. UMB7766-LJ446]